MHAQLIGTWEFEYRIEWHKCGGADTCSVVIAILDLYRTYMAFSLCHVEGKGDHTFAGANLCRHSPQLDYRRGTICYSAFSSVRDTCEGLYS